MAVQHPAWRNHDPEWQDVQYASPQNLSARIRLQRACDLDQRGWYPWVFDHILARTPKEAQILEIGCGQGELWIKNRERMPQTWHVTLTDRSKGMVRVCETALGDDRFSFQVVDGDEPLPFLDHSFQTIIANHTLYHIPHVDQLLSEVRRILVPDGTFFASTAGPKNLREIYELVIAFEPKHFPSSGERRQTFDATNGARRLNPFFRRVGWIYHPNELVIKAEHVPLLVDFVYSWNETREVLGEENRAKFSQFLRDQIAKEGSLHIMKEEGMFMGTNA
jgi:ubiquinone/menaquinone biosynthesis C-methylase UbiE